MIYADNASTTKMSDTALRAFTECASFFYGNASSIHSVGAESSEKLENARQTIADCIGAEKEEIIFTSGGTESDNQAILSAARHGAAIGKKHIVTTKIEHHAVLNTVEKLKDEGFEVTYVGVNEMGRVSPEELYHALRDDTVLVSVMHANNEIGTIEPIEEIGDICRFKGILFHSDAVQSVGHIPVDVNEMFVDYLSASAHKFHGPKGVGFLYVRKGSPISSLMSGGGQESGLRPGTLNVPAIVSMAAALAEETSLIDENAKYVGGLRDLLFRFLSPIKDWKMNGSIIYRLPGNLNISVKGVGGEQLALMLDSMGIAVSTGSACNSKEVVPSHVMLALGKTEEEAAETIRISLDRSNTRSDIDTIAASIIKAVDIIKA